MAAEACGGGDGAQGRDRTTDTAIFSRMLYQLSYLGMSRGRNPSERAVYSEVEGLCPPAFACGYGAAGPRLGAIPKLLVIHRISWQAAVPGVGDHAGPKCRESCRAAGRTARGE